jgi:hypothetical protein
LQLAKVFRASLGDLLPTLPSKLDGGGIFLFCQNLKGVALTPDGIMRQSRLPAAGYFQICGVFYSSS